VFLSCVLLYRVSSGRIFIHKKRRCNITIKSDDSACFWFFFFLLFIKKSGVTNSSHKRTNYLGYFRILLLRIIIQNKNFYFSGENEFVIFPRDFFYFFSIIIIVVLIICVTVQRLRIFEKIKKSNQIKYFDISIILNFFIINWNPDSYANTRSELYVPSVLLLLLLLCAYIAVLLRQVAVLWTARHFPWKLHRRENRSI
jgi:hypothetical protein